jgi:hypothetical protein
MDPPKPYSMGIVLERARTYGNVWKIVDTRNRKVTVANLLL